MATVVCYGAGAAAGVSLEGGNVVSLSPGRMHQVAMCLFGSVPAILWVQNEEAQFGLSSQGRGIGSRDRVCHLLAGLVLPSGHRFPPSYAPSPRTKKPHHCPAVLLTASYSSATAAQCQHSRSTAGVKVPSDTFVRVVAWAMWQPPALPRYRIGPLVSFNYWIFNASRPNHTLPLLQNVTPFLKFSRIVWLDCCFSWT